MPFYFRAERACVCLARSAPRLLSFQRSVSRGKSPIVLRLSARIERAYYKAALSWNQTYIHLGEQFLVDTTDRILGQIRDVIHLDEVDRCEFIVAVTPRLVSLDGEMAIDRASARRTNARLFGELSDRSAI